MFMPAQILAVWLRGLLGVAILTCGIALLAQWYKHRERIVVNVPTAETRVETLPTDRAQTRTESWRFGFNRETAMLLGGLALTAWALGAGLAVYPLLWRRAEPGVGDRTFTGKVEKVHTPDGVELNVVVDGPADAQPIVFVHGWGLDKNEWFYAARDLKSRFRLITWDLPGLGESTKPGDRDWSLEKLARHLDAVISHTADDKPVILLGHSIGGMICLTYCRLFAEDLPTRVARLVIAHSTYTNPVRTTSKAWLYTALQKPLLEPLCHLMIWLSPLVRVMNWLAFLNGSAHRSTERDSFSGEETRSQLNFLTSYYCKAAPDVVARGVLAMFRFDEAATLSSIDIPTLAVAGQRDGTCTPEASRHMAAEIPHCELVVLESAKHCGLFEFHERFHEVVANFIGHETPVESPTTLVHH